MLDIKKLESGTNLVPCQKTSRTVSFNEQSEGTGFFMWKAARYANDQKNSGKPAVFNRHLAIAPMVPQTRSILPFCSGVYSQVNS